MYEENFCIRRIKELMEKNHFNTYRLASKAGISLSTLTSMFDKNTDPRVQTLEKICFRFSVFRTLLPGPDRRSGISAERLRPSVPLSKGTSDILSQLSVPKCPGAAGTQIRKSTTL